MLLNHTILQLRTTGLPPKRARELGHLGYLQWLGSLPGFASYQAEAMRAYAAAKTLSARIPGAGGVLRAIGGKHAQSRAAADFDLAVQTTARRRQRAARGYVIRP